jgi:dolichol-phosphate mannosyltransferase
MRTRTPRRARPSVAEVAALGRRHARPLLAVVAVAGLAWAGWSQRDAIASFDWSIDGWQLALSVTLFAVAPLLQAMTFALGLRRIGAHGPAHGLVRVWARSFLLRYEPSGAVGFVYRVTARERMGASTAQVLTVTGYEQLAAVAAGAVAATAGFVGAGIDPPVISIVLFVGALLAAFAARSRGVARWLHERLRARGIETAGPLRGRTLALMIGLDAIGWVATGLGAWTLARALHATGGLDAFLLLGAFALSWLLGVLVPLAPGGLGLREGSLIVSLTASIGAGAATGIALALRLVSFAGELLAIAVAELLALALARRTDHAPATSTQAAALAAIPDRAGHATAPASPLPVADRSGAIVVVPTYCEAEALPHFVDRFAPTGLELLVVDDASPDGTGELADALAAERPWMHVLHRAGKDGLGMAYRAGFRWCLDRGYRAIGQMDSDLSHPPEKLTEMLAVLDEREADLVLGNRYMPGGGTAGWSHARRALSRIGCTGSKLILGLPFDDLSGGFKLWRATTLADLDFDAMLATGYAFQVETTQLAYLMGKRIEQVPFVFSERIAGESKMSLAVSLEGIRVTLALRGRARTRHGRGAIIA